MSQHFGPRRPMSIRLVGVFLALGWLRACVAKVLSVEWWSGDEIRSFVDSHQEQTIPWFSIVIDTLVVPGAELVAVAVVVAQLLIALALVLRRYEALAIAVASVLNLTFIATGAVSPSLFYLVMQALLLCWLFERERFSVGASRTLLTGAATVGVALLAGSVPFIRTLHPSAVVDDPAIALATFAVLVSATALVERRRLGVVIDLRDRSAVSPPVRRPG